MTNQICTKCILDTTVSDVKFDENGVCNFCELHKALERKYPIEETLLLQIIAEIKNRRKNKKYDCVIGVSGGVDSIISNRFIRDLRLHISFPLNLI